MIEAIEQVKACMEHYLGCILAEKIYRTTEKDSSVKRMEAACQVQSLEDQTKQSIKEKNQEYQDNTEWIEVERSFGLSKRCYGLELIKPKLYDTTLTFIVLSIFMTNIFKI